MVPQAQVRSPSDRIEMPRALANSTTATTQPAKPPWNDMPPAQSCKISSGCSQEMAGVVEHHVAEAAAEDDAERHPQHEVVEVGDRQRRRPAPHALVADQPPRVEPAEQDADDIGERVPADRERADRISTGSKAGNGRARSGIDEFASADAAKGQP